MILQGKRKGEQGEHGEQQGAQPFPISTSSFGKAAPPFSAPFAAAAPDRPYRTCCGRRRCAGARGGEAPGAAVPWLGAAQRRERVAALPSDALPACRSLAFSVWPQSVAAWVCDAERCRVAGNGGSVSFVVQGDWRLKKKKSAGLWRFLALSLRCSARPKRCNAAMCARCTTPSTFPGALKG